MVKETKINVVLLRGNEEGQGAHGQDVGDQARSPVRNMRKRTCEPADSLPVVDLPIETKELTQLVDIEPECFQVYEAELRWR